MKQAGGKNTNKLVIYGTEDTAKQWSYDAVTSNDSRRALSTSKKSEDDELNVGQRQKLISTTRDLIRNFSIAAWAVRMHLNYVTTFSLQMRTGIRDLDDQIEQLFKKWSKKQNCDVTGRNSFLRMVRMAEARAVIDSDCFFFTLDRGPRRGQIQAIEGDRCRTPTTDVPSNFDSDRFTHGVALNGYGGASAYAFCDRTRFGFELRRVVPRSNVIHHGFLERFDQVRGISPLTSAINSFQDVYEARQYALAKAKVSQFFAMLITHGGDQSVTSTGTGEGEDDEADNGAETSFDFGSGPQMLDLENGDTASFLESKTPSTEFQAFSEMMIASALKALDIPFSFYDESHTNYSGARQALLQYEQSARARREVIRELLDSVMEWRIKLWIEDGDLVLPDGMSADDLAWEWIANGLPWIDPLKEIKADTEAVALGVKSRQLVCKERGYDFFEIADQLAKEKQYMESLGLNSEVTITDLVPDDEGEED